MPPWSNWVRVCYHEAGHAVVTLALGYAAAPTVLRCPLVGRQLQAQGAYQLPTSLPMRSAVGSVLPLIMMLAAGGVAEEIQFGYHADGVTGDYSKIEGILRISRDEEGVREREANYSTTRTLLEQNWPAVARIAEIVLRRFRLMNLDNVEFPNTEVLTANALSRIFTNCALTQQEHADAQLRAFLYARGRGNGSDPEYQPHLAVEDFEKAAGDVLGEL